MLKKVERHFVQFVPVGMMASESWTIENPSQNPYEIEFPENAYAFRYLSRIDVLDTFSNEYYIGSHTMKSGMYYHPDSKIENLDEVRKNPNSHENLINSMKRNHWDFIVWTRWGNYPQPYNPVVDTVLEP